MAAHPERVRRWTLVDPVAGARQANPVFFSWPLVGKLLWQGLAVPTMADGQLTDFVQPANWSDWADRYRVHVRTIAAIFTHMQSWRNRVHDQVARGPTVVLGELIAQTSGRQRADDSRRA